MLKYLKKSNLFKGLDNKSLEQMQNIVSLKTVSKGALVFQERDLAPAFFIVGTGKIKIIKISPEGKEQIMMIASEGDSFAEAILFGDGKYPATAQAMTDSKLLVVYREKFITVIEHNPTIALNLIARLSGLLHTLNKLIEELSLSDINTRLAHYILKIVEDKNLAHTLPIRLTLSEKKIILASQLGTIPETLSRSFNKFTKDGIMMVNGSEVTITDIDKLNKFAGR